ncbi:TetR/AcrR family transcriptional regulator [Actinocorallia longicatena]|uniref:TetR/AcrR family transcriptional regulator n=1 Tax=Actinocorallia longicatena TaxID=111803 RepID=A0ABP6QK65_9ACTN
MPKQVDHDERRRTIAEAVIELVTTAGVEAASLRTVAAEAGVSMGSVQHYFKTKDEMLLFALEHGNAMLGPRVQRLLAEAGPLSLRETYRLFFTLLLPFDEQSRRGARLWAALIARGCVDGPTHRLASDAYANLTAFVLRELGKVAEAKEIPADLDLPQAARHLVSVVEGLRWPLLFGAFTPEQALAVLDAQLDRIFLG